MMDRLVPSASGVATPARFYCAARKRALTVHPIAATKSKEIRMALTATVREVGDVSVVDLNGKITLGENTQALRDEVLSLLSQGIKKLLFNMAHVGYIDSSGLGELVSAHTSAVNRGGSLSC
jgi:anti-anti-sigma factor